MAKENKTITFDYSDINLTKDAYQDLLKIIKKYPILSSNEINDLVKLAKNGNKEAKNKIIYHNLRLVVFVAKNYTKKCHFLEIIDLIQEGIIGLIKSIDGFEPNKGAFSTYAIYYIENEIISAIKGTDDLIRFPGHIKKLTAQYDLLIKKYENGKLPDDDEICKMLSISLYTLKQIRHYNNTKIVQSLNAPLNDSEKSFDVLIGAQDNDYNKILDNISNEYLFVILKNILTIKEYYLLYNCILKEEPDNVALIAKKLGVSKQRIDSILSKIIRNLRPTFINEENSEKLYLGLNKANINYANKAPITPESIAMFHYIKDSLDKNEKLLLYYQLFGDFNIEYYLINSGLTKKELAMINKSIGLKLKEKLQNENINEYLDDFVKKHKTRVFDLCSHFKFDLLCETDNKSSKLILKKVVE